MENEEREYQEQRRKLNLEHARRIKLCEEREAMLALEKDRLVNQARAEFEDKLEVYINVMLKLHTFQYPST